MITHNFEWAEIMMEAGHKVRLPHWAPEEYLHTPDKGIVGEDGVPFDDLVPYCKAQCRNAINWIVF